MKTFDQLYKENHKIVLNYIFSKTRDMELSQELANDVFMKIHTNLSKYDEKISSFKTWMMNITNNALIDYWRKVKMETVSLHQFWFDETSEQEGTFDLLSYFGKVSNDTPERQVINNETIVNFHNKLNKLPKTYVVIANLYFKDEFTYEEIANTLNIPLGTVKGQLHRVREMLDIKKSVTV